MNERIKVAIVGLGDMGVVHANAYMQNPEVKLIGICDIDTDTIDRFLKGPWRWPEWWQDTRGYSCLCYPRYKIKKVFTKWSEIAQDKEIEAVSVCLPTVFHSKVAVSMLNSGKHVLTEKPMAGSTKECDMMIEAALKNSKKLMVAHMWRFHPEVKLIRNVVESGMIGEVIKTKGYAVYVRSSPTGWFLNKDLAVGGSLLDVGIHAIDTVRYLLGDPKPERVYAKVSTVYGNYDVDDTGVVIIEFSNGTLSIVETGQNHPYADGPEASTQLFGTKGYARVFPTEVQFKIGKEWGTFKPDVDQPHISATMFQDEINHFVDCILYNKEPLATGDKAREAMKIVEAAYKSSEQKNIINLR